jgi:uncharacterized protein (TIGR03437 family)
MFCSRGTRLIIQIIASTACLSGTAAIAFAQPVIQTFAGDGQATYSGDGGMAISAALNYPKGVALDSAGNIYIADTSNFRVRRVSPAGMIYTVAGNGVNSYSGDGGQAVAASLSDVTGVAVDSAGNLYITDDSNRRIRKVGANGVITTIAGVGVQGYSGDGGPATAAMLGRPVALAFDSTGNLYYADSVDQVIRKIDTNGIITTVAGNGVDGYSGDGGPATAAALAFPIGIAIDTGGNLYIADGNNNRVREVTPLGTITTVAGNGKGGFSGDGGQAIDAAINIPSDVAVDTAGNLYIADAGNNRVRQVTPAGVISTIAGTDDNGYSGDGGLPTDAMLNYPWGLGVNPAGSVYIGDRVNSRVRVISQPNVTVAPSLGSNPALNGASFVPGLAIAPGSIVALFGSNLTTGTASDLTAPLPYSLNNTSVTFNGAEAPLFYVSPTQINAQVPFTLPVGQVQIQVQHGSAISTPVTVPVAPYSPGIFIVDYNSNAGAVLHTNTYAVVTSSNPAQPGETLAIYATGLGAVNMAMAPGAAAPSTAPFAMTVNTPMVTIGGVSAYVSFSGLAPGFVGLYQLNVTVPQGMAPGSQSLQISAGGIASNTAILAVGN